MMQRRTLLQTLSAFSTMSTISAFGVLHAHPAQAQDRTDQITLGMTLEPVGLDPTTGAASAIAEVVLYNVFETLVKLNEDGSLAPLLAQSWDTSPDGRTITFKLRKDARFHNAQVFNAQAVKFSFDRAGKTGSTNKEVRVFSQLSTQVVDDDTVRVSSKEPNPNLLNILAQGAACIVEPESAASNQTQPVGTGPYQLQRWQKGASLVLQRWEQYRHVTNVPVRRATFRFISDPAAQAAALLAGDVDVFTRMAPRNLAQFQSNPKFQTMIGNSYAKTILAMNHRHPLLKDERVRCAIVQALDRKAIITGAGDGLGLPLGSHYAAGLPGYIDTTHIHPFDPQKAQALLKQAGITTPISLNLTLPPTPYARQGGEIIAAQLAKIGIQLKLINVEWAQWLSTVHAQHQYDLTLISHVETYDLGNFAQPNYYWGYESKEFNSLFQRMNASTDAKQRNQLLGEIQTLLARECVHGFLYQPQWVTVANKRVKGVRKDMPIFVNDIAAMSWQS